MASRSIIAVVAALLCVLVYSRSAMALTEDQIALMNQLHSACVEQTGVAEALISNTKNGDFAEEEKLKCYMKCIFEQIGVIDDTGVIDGDAMIAMMPEEFADVGPPMVNKCKSVKGADACEAAFLFNKCLYNENPSGYMVI